MTGPVRSLMVGPLLGFAERLRFPRLLLLTAALFFVDLVVPDLIPFVDEILLALVTLLLSRWKKKPAAPTPLGPARG
ncbi:MAG TPA: DUF6116 family protein [Tahibacter sp.]|uniref:DUF6116 family protein n=1 Tax=Tahibacter sp. TaxID=2056211 RepID=UPI002CEE2E5D|nr:DUF6116 family protein [Tahibacter sp.]HSX62058.1 DUF6116 family protein [Tahibacter sp.]